MFKLRFLFVATWSFLFLSIGDVSAAALTAVPARAEVSELQDRFTAVKLAQAQTGRHGPYATIRRANEVANHFRNLGFNAEVYPEEGAYYVNVW
jgi:hypothetical protein